MNISLREYNKQIESMVENGQAEQAVAHCRHILKEFPLHVDTRRNLGAAYLDARKYALAKDVFLAVLLALPADFVANLGMGFIYTMEGDLEYAIWHIERAYEKNPNNIGIQEELKKLYTMRDGSAPATIQKTDGVLAYLYVNSGEYEKAEQQILQILRIDVTRREMRTLLARVYFQMGRLEQAAATCQDCFAHSPYNLEANRLMIKILQQSNSQQNLDVYRQRLRDLDPYAIHPDSWLLAEELFVPEQAVQLGKLEWTATGADTLDEPQPYQVEATAVATPVEQAGADAETAQPALARQSEPDPIPAWMRDLVAQPQAAPPDPGTDEVPQWVREIEPDPEPVYEHIEPEEQTGLPAALPISQEDQPADTAPAATAPAVSAPAFNLQEWVADPAASDSEDDLLDDPSIGQAVQQVLQGLSGSPLSIDLSDTRPNRPIPVSPSQTTSEAALLQELAALAAAEPQAEPIPPQTFSPIETIEDRPAWAENADQPADEPQPPLPPFEELDWLGDLGRVYIDPALEETRLSTIVPLPAKPVPTPRNVPDMPPVTLPGSLSHRQTQPEGMVDEPIEQIQPETDPAFDLGPGGEPAPAFEQLAELDSPWQPIPEPDGSPDEPIEEIVPEAEPEVPVPAKISSWVPLDALLRDGSPVTLPEVELGSGQPWPGEPLDDKAESIVEPPDPQAIPAQAPEPGQPSIQQSDDQQAMANLEPLEQLPEGLPGDLPDQAQGQPAPADADTDQAAAPLVAPEPQPENQEPEQAPPLPSEQQMPAEPAEPETNQASPAEAPSAEDQMPAAESDTRQPAGSAPTIAQGAVEPQAEIPAIDIIEPAESTPAQPANPTLAEPDEPAAPAESTTAEPALDSEAPLGYVPMPDEPAAQEPALPQPAPEPQPEVSLPAARGETEDDFAAIDAALRADQSEPALGLLAQLAREGRSLPGVIQRLEALSQAQPGLQSAWRTLGDAYFNNDQLAEALDAYAKADELD